DRGTAAPQISNQLDGYSIMRVIAIADLRGVQIMSSTRMLYRHTTATHLLRAGVDINTIRAWLGHVSLNTTNVYAKVDLEMKAKALATCEVRALTLQIHWRDDVALLQFLRNF
ncbi:MAG TPA: tyrosine-type recombinase/integrase, partial [Bryobacteraceae bacterium]|nr:tyrosine-type recombinase/integrase [Bryobacteraceae bacterium]